MNQKRSVFACLSLGAVFPLSSLMFQRRSDSGSRGRFGISRLLLALILAVLVSAEESKTSDGLSSTESSTTVMSTSTVGDTPKATTLDAEDMKTFCKNILDEPLKTIIRTCASIKDQISRETPLDISKESEEDITNFFHFTRNRGIMIDLIISNSSIKKLNMSTLEFLGAPGKGHVSLTLTKNKNLKDVIAFDDLEFREHLIIRGNRYLTNKTLHDFRNKNKNYDIQKEKECFQDYENDFTECERIYGDLNLTDYVEENPSFKPKAVSGCLNLENTNESLQNPHLIDNFLSEFVKEENQTAKCSGKSSISNYCIKKEMQKLINGSITNEKITITVPGSCEFVCTEEEILKHSQDNCKTINGSLSITSDYTGLNEVFSEIVSALDKQIELLKQVTIVYGEVSIDGRNEDSFGFFLSLDKIISTNPDVPALRIVNNMNARKFGFQVTKISSPAKEKIVFEKNGFNCTQYDRNELVKAVKAGSDGQATDVKCGGEEDNPPPIVTTEKPEKPKLASQQQSNAGEKVEKEEKQATGLGAGAIAGIVIGVVAVLALIAGGICIYFFVIRPRSKKKVEDNEPKSVSIPSVKPETPSVKPEKPSEEKPKLTEEEEKAKLEEEEKAKLKEEEKKKEEGKVAEKIREMINAIAGYKAPSGNTEVVGVAAYYEYFNDEKMTGYGKELKSPRAEKNNKLNCRHHNRPLIEETRIAIVKYKDEIANLKDAKKTKLDPDYIHANSVDMSKYGYSQKFIATMCPRFPSDNETFVDTTQRFFAMVFEQNVRMIIAIYTHEYAYFKPDAGYGIDGVLFTVKTLNVVEELTYKARTLEITHKASKETRKICHVELLYWPDKGKPTGDLKNYITSVYNHMHEKLNEESGTVVVHCDAGIGRTGILILCLFIVYTMKKDIFSLDLGKFEEWFKHIRDQRHGAVQAPCQYIMMPAMVMSMLQEKCRDSKDRKKIFEFLAAYKKQK